MPLNILVVDDRDDVRKTVRELIELNLPDGAEVCVDDVFPLEDVKSYASFIRENGVDALLLDERLNESKDSVTGRHTSYLGHDVVGHIRAALPDFPVFVITTFSTDPDLVAKESEFEDVVERDAFQKDPEKYTRRFQRAASRFSESMKKNLEALNALTLKAAQGELSEAEQKTLSGVRQLLGLPFVGDSDFVVSDLIAEARNLAAASERLMEEIKGGARRK